MRIHLTIFDNSHGQVTSTSVLLVTQPSLPPRALCAIWMMTEIHRVRGPYPFGVDPVHGLLNGLSDAAEKEATRVDGLVYAGPNCYRICCTTGIKDVSEV